MNELSDQELLRFFPAATPEEARSEAKSIPHVHMYARQHARSLDLQERIRESASREAVALPKIITYTVEAQLLIMDAKDRVAAVMDKHPYICGSLIALATAAETYAVLDSVVTFWSPFR
jgi:hypothetical protein